MLVTDERTLDKVRNLLELAENAGTEAEAERARERAEAMMLRHAIDEAMLADAGQSNDLIDSRSVQLPAPYAKEKSLVLGVVAQHYQVRVISHPTNRQGKQGLRCTMVGFTADMDKVDMIVTSLLLQASREVTKQRPPHRGYRYDGTPRRQEDTATYRQSWMVGFVNAVADRLERIRARTQAEADADTTGRGAELVLRDRSAAVDDKVSELFPRLSSAKPSRYSGSGADAGYAAGERADLGQDRFTSGNRRTIAG